MFTRENTIRAYAPLTPEDDRAVQDFLVQQLAQKPANKGRWVVKLNGQVVAVHGKDSWARRGDAINSLAQDMTSYQAGRALAERRGVVDSDGRTTPYIRMYDLREVDPADLNDTGNFLDYTKAYANKPQRKHWQDHYEALVEDLIKDGTIELTKL